MKQTPDTLARHKEAHRKIRVVVSRLRVVQPDAVDKNERLPEGCAPNLEINLCAKSAACANTSRKG